MDESTEQRPPMPPPPVSPGFVEMAGEGNHTSEDASADDWTGHPDPPEEETKSLTDVAREVLAGKWGTGQERRIALADAGYDPNAVKDEISRVVNNRV